jgi:hypothetical protein
MAVVKALGFSGNERPAGAERGIPTEAFQAT